MDLIDRQDAITALKEERCPCESDYDEGYLSMLDKAIWIMQEWLPSAQPESIKINIEDFNKEDWERLKKEWGNMPITVLPAQPEIIKCKDCMPTIEERKKGKWIESEIYPRAFDVLGVRTWASRMICDQCGFATYAIEGHMGQYNFCPSCGADMRGERDGHERENKL